ncbi:dipeptidase PepV [Bhargavaea beijingensis]|uniref:Dipeptidase PepV n=1 Tax=Bhargavaea beijingensis TaxID=426756 RepID=A0A1G7EMF1_9BACL|nr:dipeptidase PepV [Bhargavaea beijingensis]RSK25332.1 dipeptidase PepV [Bhargavaea beijingensis]SDE64565.1 succinyl-diaminopimelate desuccinylase [Bhargavaea beijingensis]
MDWKRKADQAENEIVSDLKSLISIKSVLDESASTGEAPFGPGPKQALDWLLERGRETGMSIKEVDGVAGHLEIGEGEGLLGILCHVDVVPAGDGWETPPFEGHERNGKVYGRGAIDDKGPTVAAFHALKMVQESGLPLNKKVRLIVGTDEESEFRCMKRYFEAEEMPEIGFAPDADFPIIHAEKGIADLIFSQLPGDNEGPLRSFHSGDRTNMVPEKASAEISVSESMDGFEEGFRAFLEATGSSGELAMHGDSCLITLHGKAAHAMEPEDGVNAGVLLAQFLDPFMEGASARFTSFVIQAFGDGSRGHALGLDFSDEISGETTLNAGILTYNGSKGGEISVSMRYSVTYPKEDRLAECRGALEGSGFTLDIASDSPPHHVDAGDPLIRTLSEVYERQTGERAELLAIGGGTYARTLEKGVAFGMLFPGRPDVAHQTDEYVDVEDLVKAAAIYADAIASLAGVQSTDKTN